MIWLAFRLVLRALWREKARALLTILAMALGVSVFLAVRLATRSALASFESFTLGLGSGSELLLHKEVGPIPERELPALAPLREYVWMRPAVEGSFAREGTLEPFQVLGVDLVGMLASLPSLPGNAAPGGAAAMGGLPILGDPQAVLISPALNLKPGDVLRGLVDDQVKELRVAGILPASPDHPAPQRNQLILDLPAAQRLLGREGTLDRLELGPREGVDAATLDERIRPLLPPGWVLYPASQRVSEARALTASFRFNLSLLSLLSLAVGAYLLFQGFDASVAQRRESWATLRALGLGPRGLMGLVLLESLLLGALGSSTGVALGWLLAQGALKGVATTLGIFFGPSSPARRQAASSSRMARRSVRCSLANRSPTPSTSGLDPRRLLPSPITRLLPPDRTSGPRIPSCSRPYSSAWRPCGPRTPETPSRSQWTW